MSSKTARLMAATNKRNAADTDVPTSAPTRWKAGISPFTKAAAIAIATDSATTTVECPSEK